MRSPDPTAPDHGPRARVGIATPQANPTVEPELRELLPATIGVYATRLVHASANVDERLHYYMRHIPEAIRSFGSMTIRAFGFGCTGSSYLAGPTLETELTNAAATLCKLPVISAAQAIRLALANGGAKRIALVSPYPEALAAAGYQYWHDSGISVVAKLRVDATLHDTHRIYELTSDDALAAMRAIDCSGADCIVASGTGMPSLRALRTLQAEMAMPVLSSNLCLAWALLREVAPEMTPPSPGGLL